MSGRRPVGAACTEDTADRGPPAIGLGARPAALAARCPGLPRAADPTPGFGLAPSRGRPERADCRHDPAAGAAQPDASVLAAGLVCAGLTAFVGLTCTSWSSSAGVPSWAGRRRPEPGPVRAGDGHRRAGVRPGAVPAGAWVSRVVHRRPALAVRRDAAVHRRPSPDQHPDERAARADGPGARRGHRRRVGTGLGRDRRSAGARRPPGRRAEGPADRARARPRPRGCRCGTATTVLGVLVVRERPGTPLTPVEERLFAGLADQAGLVLRGARLRAELEQRLGGAVRPGRGAARLPRAAGRRARRERRRLERDIHDGAQQHLVALAVNLRLAGGLAARSPDRADALLAEQEQQPPTRSRRWSGSRAASTRRCSRTPASPRRCDAAVAAMGPSVELRGTGVGRYPSRSRPRRTSAASRRSRTPPSTPRAAVDPGRRWSARRDTLTLTVEDDGRGFDPGAGRGGAGLANIRERVESVGGTLAVAPAPGLGTRLRVVLPVTGARGAERRLSAARALAWWLTAALVALDVVVVGAGGPRSGRRPRSPCTASRSSTARSSARP